MQLYSSIKVGAVNVFLNSAVLFLRLLVVAQMNEDMYRYLNYELTAEPSSIFKESLMRKTKILELRKALTDHIVDNIPSKQTNLFYVVVLFSTKSVGLEEKLMNRQKEAMQSLLLKPNEQLRYI